MAIDANAPIFVISVAAELAEMHPQTLRQYDRMGIVSPSRAPGRARRYSQRDVEMLRQVQRLSQEGVSLEGIKRIIELEKQVSGLRARVEELSAELDQAQQQRPVDFGRVFAAGLAGDVVPLARGQRPPAADPARPLGLLSLVQRRGRLRALPAGKPKERDYSSGFVGSL